MKKLLFATLAAAATAAYAGEDSTDKSGIGGTGLSFYDSPCGHQRFAGPVYPEDRVPCKPNAASGATMDMGPMMEQHGKMMEGMTRMRDGERATHGSSGGMRRPEASD